jgi:hypothetical protein
MLMGNVNNLPKNKTLKYGKPRRKRRKLPPEIAKIDVEEFNKERYLKCQGNERKEALMFAFGVANALLFFKGGGVLTLLVHYLLTFSEIKTAILNIHLVNFETLTQSVKHLELILSLAFALAGFKGFVVWLATKGCTKVVDLWEEEAKEVAKLEKAMGRRFSEKERIFLMKKLREKYEKGYKEGYDEGYSDGYTAGMD